MIVRRLLIPIVLVAAVTSACGSDADSSDDGSAPSGQDAEATTEFNEADVTFAQGMIPHHEQAVEMADIALDPASGAGSDVTDLATRIKGAQDPEIELMTGWLEAWGQPVAMDTSDGHDMASMDGMMSAEDMDALEELAGDAFDERWLGMMIEHHTGAIAMAETVTDDGSNSDVLELAGQIITAQQAEIDEMNRLLES